MNTSSIRSSATAFCVAAVSAAAFADTVMTEPVALSGVSYYQSRDTQKVHVSYTLSNQDDEPAYVVMDVLTNGVTIGLDKIKTFGDSATVSQLDGAPVAVGTHEIVWDARKDWRGNLSTNAQVQLTAFYTNRFDIYMVVDLSGGPTATHYPVTYTTVEPDPGSDYSCISNKLWLKRVNAGTFMMGSPSSEIGRLSNENQHEVTLTKPFFAGVFPVTAAQYALVTGVSRQLPNSNIYPDDRSVASLTPSIGATWIEIRGEDSLQTWPSSNAVSPGSFMGILRAKTGIVGFDLPTEAQWEYTCRAGTTTAFNNGLNGTVDGSVATAEEPGLNAYAWYLAISGGVCHRVGQKLPNNWGLYDFHGCCWEWVLDCLKSDLGTAAVTDPKTGYGQGTNNNRVQRGGAYNQRSAYCRSAIRSNSAATATGGGFRVWCNLGE